MAQCARDKEFCCPNTSAHAVQHAHPSKFIASLNNKHSPAWAHLHGCTRSFLHAFPQMRIEHHACPCGCKKLI
eukprot:12407255-Karenia_brevis.AAC.1